ncbi:hypothetical protein [Methylocystis parvus]|uniref:hypothetical protein n=1 Tax=Methylocystis parvus TaxID=134 RepID=UPI003C74408F
MARLGLAGAFAGGLLAFAWSAMAPTPDRPKPAQQSEAAKPQEAPQTASNDVAGRQILALQTEVQALRAKLDELEKRQSERDAAAQAEPANIRNQTQLRREPREIAQPAEPREISQPTEPPAEGASEKPAVTTVGRAPRTLLGYKVRDVYRGSALIETGRGVTSVAVGDVLPGAGQVTAIQKRAGRWIVATESGEIAGDMRRQARAEPPRRHFAPAPYPSSFFYLPF